VLYDWVYLIACRTLTSRHCSPLFVTWNKYDHAPEPKTESDEDDESESEDDEEAGPHLRGCIGTFSAMPLEEGLAEYAKIR